MLEKKKVEKIAFIHYQSGLGVDTLCGMVLYLLSEKLALPWGYRSG